MENLIFYNLANDIHEDKDIASIHPDIVKKMIDIIKKNTPTILILV